jgi:LPS-assembly protein
MTPDCASPRLRLTRAIVRLAPIMLGLSLSFAAQAQNNKPEDYAANEKSNPELCSPQDTNAADAQTFALDWVRLEAVPESLCDRQCINCEGRYIDPLAQENTSTPPEQADIHAHANSTRLQDNEVILTGNANAVQGYRHMRSDNVVINREQESATLSGDVTLREPNLLLQGDHAQIYSITGEAFIYDAQFVLHQEHMRGTADILQRDQQGLIHIHNGNFTYCPPGEDDWSVLSKDMEVDVAEGLATAHHARVLYPVAALAYR